ncbi:helix-turn-helix domain-containing protein [Sinomicrobium weinanense]|uniref:Helix-turn-helix transcriptional regulator n=1 Tax=Sinomicrobium weinanense TaxID=2842200 RepID=A0A926Q3R3_9FLAO|nr:helix-turn-helix transcriptional regulator [Sinomicrobium weinanense]MBC9796271.1 helix-turn-helix transcriptional regulator [Sinomicrobium weinanense]MBU3123248.1 helix-turn-helix domain-containing protein [Sinomicrobium weinanense]
MHESLDEIERYLIEKVREIRKLKKISGPDLSLAIGKGNTFISDIEAPSKKAKYNTVHLNLIAKALDCSPKDFWPDNPILEEKYNFIKVAKPRKNKSKKK